MLRSRVRLDDLDVFHGFHGLALFLLTFRRGKGILDAGLLASLARSRCCLSLISILLPFISILVQKIVHLALLESFDSLPQRLLRLQVKIKIGTQLELLLDRVVLLTHHRQWCYSILLIYIDCLMEIY